MATHITPVTSGVSALTKNSQRSVPAGVLVFLEPEELEMAAKLNPFLNGVKAQVFNSRKTKLDTVTELTIACKKRGITAVITNCLYVLQKLLPEGAARKSAKITNYAGSIIPFDGVEFLIIGSLKRLRTVPYEEFVTRTYISKIVSPQKWRTTTEFNWKLIRTQADFDVAKSALSVCDLIATDVETARWKASIRMAGYTGVDLERNVSVTYVIPIEGMHSILWMRELNDLAVPKVMQNGKYDCAYFARFGAPVRAYYYDTKNMLHAWYSELPKDLGFVVALQVRDSMYWKDLGDSADKNEQFLYNALDCWGTAEACIAWLAAAPKWAKKNYVDEFMVVPAAHMCEMTGIRRDVVALNKFADESDERQKKTLTSIRTMVNSPFFNPSSPLQVKNLMKVLGAKDKEAESSDEKHLAALSYKHPLNERILTAILDYRGDRKETSTYLTRGVDSKGESLEKEFGPPENRRILYSINPDGTDTGRNASREHHFWCGLQIQNIGSNSDTKETFIADDGWDLWEADYSQAEDRGVAYKSGDPNLLEIFAKDVDSHSYKASMFFGIPYEEIFQPAIAEHICNETGLVIPFQKKKVLLEDIRQLGKKVNHGANYNMGARVLVDTMGAKALRKAQVILKLPAHWDLLGIASHLLNAYEKAFPTVKKDYYNSIIKEIKISGRLTGDTGWTRYCFQEATFSKMALNAYVAHVTQSLNAMILNKAFVKVFNVLGFNPNFKLLAQIHDSILFSTKKGHEYLAVEVQKLMTFPVPITDCKGVVRDLTVPVDIKNLGRNWRGSK
jgi:DNA polymerase I-like protein with 3'-5' exonuclease and polymerase domains